MQTNREIETIIPLTELQEGMLYHLAQDDSQRLHWNQLAFTVKGSIDLERYCQAWQVVMDREPALRAAFVTSKDGRALQVIQKSLILPITNLDWSLLELPEQASAERVFLANDEASAPQLNQAPLMRVCVAKLGDDRFRVIWSQHHLIVDGWSCPLVLERVNQAYLDLAQNKGYEAPQAARFADYVSWSRETDTDQAVDVWREYLAGYTPAPVFTEKRADIGGVAAVLELDATLIGSLDQFSRRLGITLATVLQGCWAITMAAETGQDDVVFGLMHADRDAPLAGIENMVGLAVRTVLARFDTASSGSLATWLQEHQKKFGAMLGARLPLATVVDSVRGELRGNLFESLVVVENFSVGNVLDESSSGWNLTDFSARESTSYPLTLTVHLHAGIELVLTTDGSIGQERGERFLSRFSAVLHNMLANADAATKDISWLLADEPETLESNEPLVQDDLLEQILCSAQQQPNKVAVEFEGQAKTYAELWQDVLSIESLLVQQGVGANSRVVINLERSPLLICAMLAIWRCNATYIPLGHDYPTMRINDILDDVGASLLLTCRPNDFSELGIPVIDEGDMLAFQGEMVASASLCEQDESPLAYIIYTSGSTGKPNGVSVSRANVESFLAATRLTPGISESDRLLAVTNVTFDIAVMELLLPLSVGATVLLASTEESRDGFALLDLAKKCTLMQGTPATWHLMLAAGWTQRYPMRAVTGGEALNPPLAAELLARSTELWNAYGPTEATVWATFARVDRADDIAIGTPLAGTTVVVSDRAGRTLPPGVVGQLCIGGANVAQGYWQRPLLTAERFQAGTALGYHFRTGDLARSDASGRLFCLGRQDHQIKLRGFRIELGEIEIALESHQAVDRACVVHDAQQEILRAFVTMKHSAEDIREYLSTLLPNYMIPQHLVTVEHMPLNNSGKIDRSKLNAASKSAEPRTAEPPEDEAEKIICALMAEILGIESVSTNDFFFNLGGHSLLAMKLIVRVEAETGIKLPPAAIAMEAVHELASRLKQAPRHSLTKRVSNALRGVLGAKKSPGSQ